MPNPVEAPATPAPEPAPEGRLGPIGRARASLTAIETLLRLREDQTTPTEEDLSALRHWPGWGPLAPALAGDREGTWAEIGEELQRLLSPREYRQAEQGTSTAYYTPDRIAEACWTALQDLGFRGGRVLEPGCGAGTFINHTPDRMPVEWYGVERDPTTAGIAALLHPNAKIINARLQDAGLQTNSVDAVLGNVPYGNFQVHDKTAPKAVTDSIHNYFIWRSVQALRPGGVAILLTSRYTMDSADDTARRAIAKHADLLGAVRLPNGALAEGGTGVLADILIVRRRDTDGPLDDSWMKVSEVPEVPGQSVNNYFLEHPENVLGTFEEGRAARYGHTLAVKAPEGQDLAVALGRAFDGITAAARSEGRDWRVAVGAQPFTEDTLPFPVREDGRKEGSFHLVDGKPHEVIDGELVAVARAGKELPKLIALRDATLKLIEAETDHDTPDVQLDPLRAEVNRLYDAYVRAHGPINRFTLAEGAVDEETGEKAVSRRYPRLGGFRRDPDFVSVLALEDFDDETQKADKAPLLLRRVNRRIERPTSAETPEEALSLCLNFKNKVDVPTIAQLLGIEEDQVPGALGDLVFPDPDSGELLTRGAYLSGPVVDKLERAEFLLSQGRDDLQRHVDALREVQPEPLPPEDIKAKLGAPWIPVEDVTAFAEEMLGVRVDIIHVAKTATWNVDMPMTIPEAATSEWGTSRVNAFELLDLALNGQAPKVYDTFHTPDGGSRRVRNDKETMLAESKMTALMRRFASWVWEDPERADRLAADYNRIFNSTILPKHDGSHLTVDGMDPEFKPYEHQWDFVQRVLSADEGSLCPYPVGAGKTATMFMTAIKLKQLGLVNKPMIVVPNHLLEQISRDGKKLFPNAKILMAGKKDLADARSRMLFAARCATGDWDAIVMTHNSFGRLGVHPVTEATYLEELANEYRVALGAIDGDDANQRRIKEIAKMVDRFDARASDLRSKATDAGVTYENLGVDFLQVDEAHLFKNLALPATTEGMSLGKPSKRATDLDLKLIVTRERTGRDNVTALYSGTFISNSVREMYVFQHYTMPKRLEKLGLGSPDAWAANFIQFESRPEVGVDGVSFRLKRRPVEYTNADEALALFAEVAELRPREEFKIKRPKRVDRFIEVEATPNLVQYVSSISDRIDQIQSGKVKPFEDNMLNVITDGRKAALDLELVGMEPDGPGKVGAVVRNVLEIHERTKNLKFPGYPDDVSGGLQLLFCDLGTPSKDRGSQVYGKIRRGLIDGLPEEGLPGIPRERIRFIHDYNSDLAKEQLFSDARAGKVSVLFMSSEKGGTGVNVQTLGVALHHVDPPHKPAEWEQREGRLDRPGNLLIDLDMPVEFYRYIALNSFDSYMFQQLERKQRPIVQIMSGRKVGRVIQEIDPVGAGFGQAKAIATGNPMLLELADVNGELTMLLNEADGHRQAQARMKRKVEVLGDQIRDAERTLPSMRAMADAITAAGDDDTWRTADGRLIDPDEVAGVLAQTAQGSKPTLDLDAGYRWRGLQVGFTWHRRQQFGGMTYEGWAHLVAGGQQVDVRLNLSWFGKGQSWRIVKALGEAADEAATAPAEIEHKVAKWRAALEDTRSHIGRPFEKHADLEAVRERKAALEEQISGAAVASDRESGAGPQFDPGAAGADGGREMTEAEMAMHDATVMAGMLGGTAVVVSEGQIIGGARVVNRTDVDLQTPDLTDPRQWDEAFRAFTSAAAADADVQAWAQIDANEGEPFREGFAEWAQDWVLEHANLPENRPAWLRAWLDPEGADTRRAILAEAAGIAWQQARAAAEVDQAPPAAQDTPPRASDPEPAPAPEESAAPSAPSQVGPEEPAPAAPEAPQAPAEDAVEPASAASAEAPTGDADRQPLLQGLVNALGDRVMVGHISGPQPARTHQSAGWAIMAVLSDDQVRGLVSAVSVDGQPVSTEPGAMPTEHVREWIAEQQQTPTTAFYASTSSELPPALRGDGDVRLSARANGLTIEQGDVTTTILWEELPAWIDAAVAHNTDNRDPYKPWWRYGRLDHEIHFRRDENNQAIRTAMNALAEALRETVPPTDEQLAEARDRYAPPAAAAPGTATEPAAADEENVPEESEQLPEDAVPVPGAEGYHYTEEGRTVRLYTDAGEEVGTAKWSYSKYRYLGDVQGDTVRGTEDSATVAKRMANHHAVVYGDRVHWPTLDDQGRDPVWILHNGSDTLVFGVSPEDDTARAAMWTGGGFKESRKVGGWYVPRTWKEPTRRQRVDDVVRVLAAAGRTVTVHSTREERQQPPQRPARLPELEVTAPNLNEVPQLYNAAPFTDQDDLQDVRRLEAAYDRWSQHPTVRAYLQQDNDARPDGFGTPDNPIAELHATYHRARLALQEPVPGGPDEIVRRVHGVAAWCMALEPAVERDLLDPLQDVYAAAHGLAARSQATIAALTAERDAAAEAALAPAEEASAAAQQDQGTRGHAGDAPPGTLADPGLREPALETFTAAALADPRVAQAARANDINNFVVAVASWSREWLTGQWADVSPNEWPDWVRAYFREGDNAVDDRNGLYAELAGPLYAQFRTTDTQPAPAPFPDLTTTEPEEQRDPSNSGDDSTVTAAESPAHPPTNDEPGPSGRPGPGESTEGELENGVSGIAIGPGVVEPGMHVEYLPGFRPGSRTRHPHGGVIVSVGTSNVRWRPYKWHQDVRTPLEHMRIDPTSEDLRRISAALDAGQTLPRHPEWTTWSLAEHLAYAQQATSAAAGPLVIIPCGSSKLDHKAPAGELYVGPYHRSCREAADALTADGGTVLILSAKFGLVTLDHEIEPYDLRMGEPGSVTVEKLREQALDLGVDGAQEVVILAGETYSDAALQVWPNASTPLAGLGGLGYQRKYLAELAAHGADAAVPQPSTESAPAVAADADGDPEGQLNEGDGDIDSARDVTDPHTPADVEQPMPTPAPDRARAPRGGSPSALDAETEQLGLFGDPEQDPAEGPTKPETAKGRGAVPADEAPAESMTTEDERGAQLQAALIKGETIAPVSFTDQRQAAGWILTTTGGHTFRLRPVAYALPDEDQWEAGHDADGSGWWAANVDDRPLAAVLARIREDSATRTRFASLWARYGHLTAQAAQFETTTDRIQLEEGVYLVRRFGRVGLIASCRWGWEHLTDPDGAQGRTGEDWSRKGPDNRQYAAEWKIWNSAQSAIANARLRVVAQLSDDMADTPDAYCDASTPYVGKCSAKRSGARYTVAVVTDQGSELGCYTVCARCLSHRLLNDEDRHIGHRDVQSLVEDLAKGDPKVGDLHWKQWPDRIAELAGQMLSASLDAGETAPWPAQALTSQILAEACEAGDDRAMREARAQAKAAGGDTQEQKQAAAEVATARRDRAALVARRGAPHTEAANDADHVAVAVLELAGWGVEGGDAAPEPAEEAAPEVVNVNALTVRPQERNGEPSRYEFTVTGPGLTVGEYKISHDNQGKGARGIMWRATWHGVEASGRWDVISIGSGRGKDVALAAVAEHATKTGGDLATGFTVARRMHYDAGLWLLPEVGESEAIQYHPDGSWTITAETGALYTVRWEWEGRTASGGLAPLLIEDQAGTLIASCTAVDGYMSAWAPMLERLRLHATAVADGVPHATAVTLGGPGRSWVEAWCVCSWTERADVAEYAGRASAGEALALAHRQAHDPKTPAAAEAPVAAELPELDVVLPDVDLATLDVAGPYETDEEAQTDIDRLSTAFAQWDALPTVQRFYETDRQQRPDGQRIPTNPVAELAAAYRDAERMLREGPVVSPDDLVLEVHTVAVWSGVLEPVVDEDLRGPLRQVREAAALLASRSYATVAAFEAELTALTAESAEQTTATTAATEPPPASAPTGEGPGEPPVGTPTPKDTEPGSVTGDRPASDPPVEADGPPVDTAGDTAADSGPAPDGMPVPQDAPEPAASVPVEGMHEARREAAFLEQDRPETKDGEQQMPEPGPAAAQPVPAGEDAPSDETARDASEEQTMTTPPIPETADAPSPGEPTAEDPPAPQRYFMTEALAGDPGYQLRLSGLDGQRVDSGDVLRGDLVIATIHPSSGGGWYAELSDERLPADATLVTGTPEGAASNAAIMYSAFTGAPYGPPASAAVGDRTRRRVDVLRAELRDAALQHREAISSAAARAYYPASEQNEYFRELVSNLDGLAAAVSDSHGSQQMTQYLDGVQRTVNNWGSALPVNPGDMERRQLAFPLAHLLYDSRRLQDRVQATLDAVQAERVALGEQATSTRHEADVQPGPATPADTGVPEEASPDFQTPEVPDSQTREAAREETTPAPPSAPANVPEPESSGAAVPPEEVLPKSRSSEVPDSQTSDTTREFPAAPAEPMEAPSPQSPDGAAPSEDNGSAVDTAADGIRRSPEDAQAARPEAATVQPGELPLWTGTKAPSTADTGAKEPSAVPLDVRAEFESVLEGWREHVPSENGTAQDLVASLEADLATLQHALAEAIAPAALGTPPAITEQDTAAPDESAAAALSPPVSRQAADVNAALQQADTHATVLLDVPGWQKIQTVRGAFGHLFHVMKERAGEHFDRLMGDHRVGEFIRKVSIAACDKIAGWAQAAADHLRRRSRGDGPDTLAADALQNVARTSTAYGFAGNVSGPLNALPNGRSTTAVDIPEMRKLGEALSRPLPSAANGRAPRVSTAAARGRSTTQCGAETKKLSTGEQAAHLRRSGSERPQSYKPSQR